MARLMKAAAVASALVAALFAALYRSLGAGALLSLAITSGTIAYHLWMRLAVGGLFALAMGDRARRDAAWFRQRSFEPALYRRLRVHRWKAKMPTYDASLFDPKKRGWEEIAQAMCQAELVHETCALLSFLPVVASRWFGALPAFLITSLLSAGLDLAFVAMQRYNRPVVARLAARVRGRRGEEGSE